jgi:hypothetical protein
MSVRTSASLFFFLGVPPALGRTFTNEEVNKKPESSSLSHGLWLRRLVRRSKRPLGKHWKLMEQFAGNRRHAGAVSISGKW